MSDAQGRSFARWALAALVALTLLAYLPALSAGFTNWDDDGYVTDNVAVQRGDVVALLLEPFEGNHHPVTMLSLGANHAWSGLDAGSYHFVNVLLHLGCTLLVFLFVSGLLQRQAMARARAELVALATSAVFALHPMHVESVAWVSARKDPLYTLFFLLALLVYLRHGDRPRVGTLLAALGFGALAMLSKPAAVVLPVVLVLVDWLRARPLRGGVLAEKLPFFALSIGVGLATLSAQHAAGATSADSAVPLGRSLLHACYGLMMYGVRFVAPLDLAPFYPLPDASAELPGSYLLAPLVVLTLAAVAVVLHRKGARTALFALAFFVLNLALVLQVKQVGGAVMADRYTYVPYIGLGLLAGLLLERATRERGDGVALASIGVLGLALAPLAWRQAGFWRDSETLWERALAVAPSGRAFANRGQLRQRAGDAAGALADYEQALALELDNVAANSNRGILLLERNELDEALVAFEAALAREPRNGPALVGRALVRHRRGDVAGALADCDTAVAANPMDAIARGNRGFFRQQVGERDAARSDYEAALALDARLEVARAGLASLASGETGAQRSLEDIERALELEPGDAALRYERATQLQKLRRLDEALADGERAVSAAPQDIRYRERVCELLAQRGDFQRAEPECRRLLELDASNGVACNLLAAICMQQGRNEEALGLLERSLAARPRDAQTLQNRAIVLLQLQRLPEAVRDLEVCLEVAPQNAAMWSDLGALRMRVGQLPGAVEAFTRAIGLDRNPTLRMNRALALLALGRTDEARADSLAAREGGVQLPRELEALVGSSR